MKTNVSKILILVFFVAIRINCIAQSTEYFTENSQRINAYLNGPVEWKTCEGEISFPQKYKASKIKSDAFVVSFVNAITNNQTTADDIGVQLKKVGKKKALIINESISGLIQTKEILLKGNYLRANVIVGFIDNIVVRSKVRLTTVTHAKCGVYDNRMMDFQFVKDFFIKDAKMLFSVTYDEMSSDTIYFSNLTSLAEKRKDYRFNIPGTSSEGWINEIFTKQYQTDSTGSYNYAKAPKDFARLIKENKTEVIKDLLFSPNYFTSINAMEALLYLTSVNKVQLTAELSSRIAQIKNGSFIIMQQGAPDVFYKREGYKELHTTDDRVVNKYTSSM